MERRNFLAGVLGAACCSCIGCNEKEPTESRETDNQVYKCPVCGKVMEKDAYCTKCNTVAALERTVHCDICNMDKKTGVYCAKCNRFMFADEIKCDKANKTIVKGTFCEKKKVYRRLPTVGYCEKCEKPFDKKTGCPVCGKT